MHDHEIDRLLGGKSLPSPTTTTTTTTTSKYYRASSTPIPPTLDWSSKDNPLGKPIITPPQNQGHCGELEGREGGGGVLSWKGEESSW